MGLVNGKIQGFFSRFFFLGGGGGGGKGRKYNGTRYLHGEGVYILGKLEWMPPSPKGTLEN